MSTPEVSGERKSKRASTPRWFALVLLGLVYGVGPWALSLLTPRYGWAVSRPGIWNLLGIIPVVIGTACLMWTMALHFARAPRGFDLALTQNYLLRHGPYAFTRHPMYLFELLVLLGWAVFYGSVAVLIAFLIVWAMFHFVAMPVEERALEARFGASYRQYKDRVPRWFRTTRH